MSDEMQEPTEEMDKFPDKEQIERELSAAMDKLEIADEHAKDYQAEISVLLGNGERPSDDIEKSMLRRTIRWLQADLAAAHTTPPAHG
jgi:hypothetical protein